MIRKAIGVLMILTAASFALPVIPTTLDSVKVPAKIIKGSGVNWTGKVTYYLSVGDNDSLQIVLSIAPASTTPTAPTCTVTKTSGDAGIYPMITGLNGKREIFFECTFASAPAASDQYVATVTVTPNMSANEQLARSVLAAIPNNTEKAKILCGGNGVAPAQHDAFCTGDMNGGTYGTVVGLSTCDGPHGINGWGWGQATMFPCNGTTANAWDTALTYQIGQAIAQEAKGLWQGRFQLLGPMLNLVRDPRGGRDYETFGEDPYLMGKLASVDIRGIQSEKIVATPKHFLCNDQERDRTQASMNIDTVTMRQTYAYPFEMTIREAGAWGLMAAYNKVNGVLCTENSFLLNTILKKEWGFRGLTISDWSTMMTVAAGNAGLDVQMPENTVYSKLPAEITGGRMTQDVLDEKVLRVLRAKAWAGCMTTYPKTIGGYTIQQLHDGAGGINHQLIADTAAHRSIVLLKNDIPAGAAKPILPIDRTKTVAVVGPYANILRVGGNGQYTSSKVKPFESELVNTPLQAITRKLGAAKITTDINAADYIVVVVGIASDEGTTSAAYEGQDRPDATLSIPDNGAQDQNVYVQGILATKKDRTIVVLTGGAAVTSGAWYTANAVIYAGYGGEKQGIALADILVGDYNPCGKLTITFPVNQTDLPTFTNADQYVPYEKANEGRGYPYYLFAKKAPLIPFGFGLSYTTFTYSALNVPSTAYIGDKLQVTVNVTNSGATDGVEIVQLYISQKTPVANRPVKQLRGFARVPLKAGQSAPVTFNLKEWDFAHWTLASGWIVDPNSTYEISVGKNSMDNAALTSTITMLPAD